jgi:hypothetical protein
LSVVSLLVLYLVHLSFGSSVYQLTASDRSQILNYHNQIRSNYGLPALVYDVTIEANASSYAGGCVWAHSVNGGKYGENLAQYAASPATKFPLTSWMSQVDGWYEEYKYWTCSTGTCSSTCGHLTQIISKSSTNVGCGVAQCDPGTVSSYTAQFLVCQYVPPGNVNLGTQHPVTGLAYPDNGCPATNPALTDSSSTSGGNTNSTPSSVPTVPVPTAPVTPPSAPIGTPKPVTPTAPPTMPPAAPVAPPTIPPAAPTAPYNANASYSGCQANYWPNGKQLITPCHAAPMTFTVKASTGKSSRQLYCDCGDPSKNLWPVLNPNTAVCNYVASLVDDAPATTDEILPMYAWIGIAVGSAVLIIIIIVIIILVKKGGATDERV